MQLLLSLKFAIKRFHKKVFSVYLSVTYDKFMYIIGIAFHNDGKQWKYECHAVLLRCCGIKCLLLAPDVIVEELKLINLLMLN